MLKKDQDNIGNEGNNDSRNEGVLMMNKILSVFTLTFLLLASTQFAIAMPANLTLLNDVKISTSADNTKIEFKFDRKPGQEKLSYRDDFVQIEFGGTYTDPPKQWHTVEDEIVKNMFVYQFDANTVRVRLFTYGKSVSMRERIIFSKANNGFQLSYGQRPAAANKKSPVTAKANSKNNINKFASPNAEVDLPRTEEKVVQPAETDSVAGSNSGEPDMTGDSGEAISGQSSEETVTDISKADGLPGKNDVEEVKPVLLNDSSGFSGSVIKMITALGIVLSLLFGIVFFVKKYLGNKIGLAGKEQKIKVLTSTYLGPKKSIALVEVAGEKIVVGVTATTITMLTKVSREEDFEEVLKDQVSPESTDERVELQDELWEKV